MIECPSGTRVPKGRRKIARCFNGGQLQVTQGVPLSWLNTALLGHWCFRHDRRGISISLPDLPSSHKGDCCRGRGACLNGSAKGNTKGAGLRCGCAGWQNNKGVLLNDFSLLLCRFSGLFCRLSALLYCLCSAISLFFLAVQRKDKGPIAFAGLKASFNHLLVARAV